MFRSIRRDLLLWYALILLGVLGAFGATLYYQQRHSMLREVDGALEARARSLAASIEVDEGVVEFEHAEEFIRSFGGDGFYFIVWGPDGRVLRAHGDPGFPSGGSLIPLIPPEPGVRRRDHRREEVVTGPAGSTVLVGRSIEDLYARLQGLMRGIVAAALAVVVLALAGGWFLAGRAIRPIRRAFDQKTRFTADASHELRTPLSIVLAQSELALSRERSPEEYRQAIETTLQAAKRMKAVVDGLLTLARADAGGMNLKQERVEMGALVEESVALLRPLALERGVSLDVDVRNRAVVGDPDRLREAVTNLVSNAIRYNRDGGRVRVSLEGDGGEAVLSVADTGIGIPASEQGHIFERFHRVDKARSRDSGGSGLGLAITQWIVQAHRGRIAFTSEEGRGTTFTVRLPEVAARPEPSPEPLRTS